MEVSGTILEEMVGRRTLGWGKWEYYHGMGLGLTHCAYRVFPLLIEDLSFVLGLFDFKITLGRLNNSQQAAKKHSN